MIGQLSAGVWGWSEGISERQVKENNLNAADYRLKLTQELAQQLMGRRATLVNIRGSPRTALTISCQSNPPGWMIGR